MAKVSILELIAQNVQTTIAGVTTDNGYDYSLTVERAKKKAEPKHLKAIIYQSGKTNTDPDANTADEKEVEFTVVTFVLPINDNDEYDVINNHLADAIEAELLTDVTRGGYAYETTIQDVTIVPAEKGEWGGFNLTFTVKYRYPFGQPFIDVVEPEP